MLMVLGVWVMILCGPGFPNEIKQVLAVITGILIIFIAYRIKPDHHAASPSSRPSAEQSLPYIESRNG